MRAQEPIDLDIVNPYERKVSRTAEADTFYFTQNKIPTPEITKQDTFRTYDVFLEERVTPFGIAYMCNGKEVTKQKYSDYKLFWNSMGACQPCLLYTYNDKNELKHIAYQYEDCLCGEYKEFYPEGNIKIQGQFMQNPTNTWENIKSKGVCSKRDGKWTYYTEEGNVLKVETYTGGKLIESIYEDLKTTTTNKTTNTTPPESKGIKRFFKKKPSEPEDTQE